MLQIPAGAPLTFGLLTAAIAALWLPRNAGSVRGVPVWLIGLVASTVSGYHYGFIAWPGALALAVLGWAAHVAFKPTAKSHQRTLGATLAALIAAGLMAHVLPGFANPRVIDAVTLSPAALPYSKYLNFDKGAAGLLLVALGGSGLTSLAQWRRPLATVALSVPATAGALLALSWAMGYVTWEPGWPPILLFWTWTNLAFTCVAEEALFRGLVQRHLSSLLAAHRFGAGTALVVAALLFGLAHAAGGGRYIALSAVAGLGYGWAYQRGGLEASIATHFLVNLTHFMLFTYPALASG